MKNFNQQSDDPLSWFEKVPGLKNEIELMAWSHRSQAPLIFAVAPNTDAGGRTVRVQMIPRSFWDENPRFLDTFYCRYTRRDADTVWRVIVFLLHAIRVRALH
jgi:hypothetical protein